MPDEGSTPSSRTPDIPEYQNTKVSHGELTVDGGIDAEKTSGVERITIEEWEACFYVLVWEITGFKDGAISDMQSTGRYLHIDNEGRLNRMKYTTSPTGIRERTRIALFILE